MFCENCGTNLQDTTKPFCPECGTKVKDQPKPEILSKEMECKDDLRILLVGHTGHGKSATGNSLLGITSEEGFYAEMSGVSVTDRYQRMVKQRFGRRLEVVDTPGIFDSSLDDEIVYKQIARCVGLTLPGFNAICLVLLPGRFSMEMVKTVDIFLKFFGKGIDDYAFVILTHIASEEKMKQYINAGDKKPDDKGIIAFNKLRKRCKEKVLFIENSVHTHIKEEMVWKILTAVDEANAKASKPYFQNKLTREIQQRATEFYLTNVCGHGSERAKEDLRILLLGLPNHGKSATGNSLLGNNMFTEKPFPEPGGEQEKRATECANADVTILIKSGENAGRNIHIVEFPVKDPSIQSDNDFLGQLLQAERMLNPGVHAFCFVIDPNKISELKDEFKRVIEYFGDDSNDYAFVIMTFTKHEDDFEKKFPSIMEEKHPQVTSVLQFCKSKQLYIDNKVSPVEKQEMITEIFTSIDSANVKKFFPHFSSHFKRDTEAAEATAAAKAAEAAKAVEIAKATAAAKAAEAAIKAAKAAEIAKATEAANAIRLAEIARVTAENFRDAAETAKNAAKASENAANIAKTNAENAAIEANEQKENEKKAFELYKTNLETTANDMAEKLKKAQKKYDSDMKQARDKLKNAKDRHKQELIDAEARSNRLKDEAVAQALEDASCSVM